MSIEIKEGETFTVPCPFIWSSYYSNMNEDGFSEALTWRPGVDWQFLPPDSSEPVAHGVGKVFYTVVSLHKPPHPYPARVFYTRKYETPDGRRFGKGRLLITTAQAFRRRLNGYKPRGVDGEIKLAPLSEAEKQALLQWPATP